MPKEKMLLKRFRDWPLKLTPTPPTPRDESAFEIVVLASEPVGGRSRATELPCYYSIWTISNVIISEYHDQGGGREPILSGPPLLIMEDNLY